ncbi:hypothetical protein JW890_02780 [candidate division WOR-3 bacterium]|nr:hypothetical protein [candidate division WOR-3 bacterium]
MNRHDVNFLQQMKSYPSVTMTLPAHRSAPENKQDPIRVKNLFKETTDRLLKEFGKREVEPLLTGLENAINSFDFQYSLDGLAFFANRDFARVFNLPFPLEERVVVEETFFTRDLVFALNRTPRYWFLALSEKPTKLFEGVRENLTEIREGGFPITHEGPGGSQPLPGGFGIDKSAHRDERHRQFFRKIDETLKPFIAEDPLPLALAGVDRYLSFYNEMSEHKKSIIASVEGSYDKISPHELGKLIWPEVEKKLAVSREEVLLDLEKAVGEKKFASNVTEVFLKAKEGRGRILLVEEDFHYPARFEEGKLVPAEDPSAQGVIDDVVDDIIEEVLSKNGKVVFVNRGQLNEHGRIALILRY